MKKLLLTAVLVVAFACSAFAAQESVVMGVSADVQASIVVSVTPINFSVYDGSIPVQVNGNVTVNASMGVPIEIGMDGGQNGDGCAMRFLEHAPSLMTLSYDIWQGPGPGMPWGDSTPLNPTPTTCDPTWSDMGQGMPMSYPFTAEIPPGQPINATGMYNDVVTVSVFY